MARIPKINDKDIILNALFIQPTYNCAYDCDGCYVKGMERNSKSPTEYDRIHRIEMIRDTVNIFSGRACLPGHEIRANQITFAVDTKASSQNMGVQNELYDHFNMFKQAAQSSKACSTNVFDQTEFHVTTFSPKTLRYYEQGELPVGWGFLDMITFSTLSAADAPFLKFMKATKPQVHLNWNLTIFNKASAAVAIKNAKEVAEAVDTIYLVLHKPATGDNLDIELVKLYFETMEGLKRELGKDFSKVNIDGCVTDARKFRDTGFGCSSNISRFQVWPDGSVSGCPYQQHPVTPGANGHLGVLDNIRAAAKKYEFDDCRIPQTLHPNSERTRERSGRRVPKSRNGLAIID